MAYLLLLCFLSGLRRLRLSSLSRDLLSPCLCLLVSFFLSSSDVFAGFFTTFFFSSFFLRGFPSSELDDSESLSELEELELLLLELLDLSGILRGFTFGAFFKCSRNSAVSPPSPIEVKKLIAKRVFLGSSRGNRPSKWG